MRAPQSTIIATFVCDGTKGPIVSRIVRMSGRYWLTISGCEPIPFDKYTDRLGVAQSLRTFRQAVQN